MENFMNPKGIIFYTGIVLTILPCLMVTTAAPAPPKLTGLSTPIKDNDLSSSPRYHHLNSVYSNSALPSEYSNQKPQNFQKILEKVPSPNFPGIEEESTSYSGYQPPHIYRPPHQDNLKESSEVEQLEIMPRLPPAFSPELKQRPDGQLGPLSLLDQLAPSLW